MAEGLYPELCKCHKHSQELFMKCSTNFSIFLVKIEINVVFLRYLHLGGSTPFYRSADNASREFLVQGLPVLPIFPALIINCKIYIYIFTKLSLR